MGKTFKRGKLENNFYTDKRKGEIEENINIKEVKKQLKQNRDDKKKRG